MEMKTQYMADRMETIAKFEKMEKVQSEICEKVCIETADLFADESIDVFDSTFAIKAVDEVSSINTKLCMEPLYKAKLVINFR